MSSTGSPAATRWPRTLDGVVAVRMKEITGVVQRNSSSTALGISARSSRRATH